MNLGRRRATNALARTRELERQHPDFKRNYRSYVDRLGPAIVMNGLGQALATERAAAAGRNPGNVQQSAHHELYKSLEGWLCRQGAVYESDQDLLHAIVRGDEAAYLRAQAEALAWLEWHKKFCRAFFPADDGATE